jgi:hypothetical protein
MSGQLGPAEGIHIYYTGNGGFPQNNLVAINGLQLFDVTSLNNPP